MKLAELLGAWRRILAGERPSLSIEITRECPLRCPGCYAYEDNHLGGGVTLRQLSDYKGEQLIRGVLELVDRFRPMHLSIVGGDPLVRYRELESLLPQLVDRGVYVQLVTSAFRAIPRAWSALPRFNLVVSIDGLQPEHDARRSPATYERILKNIQGHPIIVHCTITAQMMKPAGYLEKFLAFWSDRPEVRKIWFSLFTPQRSDARAEILTAEQRQRAVRELLELRERFPKLGMGPRTIRELARPPQSPEECIFAKTTHTISADLRTPIAPCQFGGDPDCAQCGCLASAGLAAIGRYRLAGLLRVETLFNVSAKIGALRSRKRRNPADLTPVPEFRVLQ
jgi:MoaA/NifB/PqqE/SkfB family radical SAM enzyme